MSQSLARKEKRRLFWDKIFYGQKKIDLSVDQDGSDIRYVRKRRPILPIIAGVSVVALIVISFLVMNVSRLDFNWSRLGEIISQMFSPYKGDNILLGGYNRDPETCALTFVFDPITGVATCDGYVFGWKGWFLYMWEKAIPELWRTIEMCFVATIIGGLISVPIYYLSANNVLKKPAVHHTVRIINDFLRTIPTLVLAVFATLIFGYNNLSGIVALVFFTLGIMYKLMYEYIETIDMNPREATRSAGASLMQDIAVTIHPVTKPMFLANLFYVFEMNIRGSVILGYIGAGGIGYLIQSLVSEGRYESIGAILVPLFIVVFILQLISNAISRKLR